MKYIFEFYSEDNTFNGSLWTNNENSKIKDVEITEEKLGGLTSCEIKLTENISFPIYIFQKCYIYIDSTLRYVGYVSESTLENNVKEPSIHIYGYAKLFEKNKITMPTKADLLGLTVFNYLQGYETDIFTASNNIINAIAIYDSFGALAEMSSNEDEISLKDLFDSLVIQCSAREQKEFRWYFDNGTLVFKACANRSGILYRRLYEGYDFNKVETKEVTDNIINTYIVSCSRYVRTN